VRILLHCTYYVPEVGGLESHVAELARGLAAEGHEVRVVTSLSMEGLPAEETRDGVMIRRTRLPSRSPAGWAAHALGSIPLTRKWARWADVVHAQAFASVLPCRIAARTTGRPLVATFHTSHFLTRATRRGWRPLLGSLVRAPDHCLAASEEIAEVASGLGHGRPVEALTNGVDTERFAPGPPALPAPDGVRQIVVPRRLFAKNGVEYFVRALPSILREEPSTRALLIGDGPERERLEALARELDVAPALQFLGRRTHDEMPGLLASGELAVFPSLMEATSVAALECMACGIPVVATRVGGLPQIVREDYGRLVPPADPEGLARGIIDLLRDPDLPSMGPVARARVVAQWSNARLVKRHLEIYRSLLAHAGPSADTPADTSAESAHRRQEDAAR